MASDSDNRAGAGEGRRGFGTDAYFGLLLVCSAILILLGGRLLMLGGTPYYVLAGLAMLLSAILVWRKDRRAAWVYALILLGTLGWTWWEIGLDLWGLVSRFAAFIIVGLPMFWIWLGSPRRRLIGFGGLAVALAVLLGVGLASPVSAPEAFAATTQASPADGDWRFIGRDIGGTRYAPFTEINTSNVNRLEVAWTYRAGSQISETTPLKIGDALYFCTFDNQVISLDAETGKQRWHFDPKLPSTRPAKFCRGVAYHADTKAPAGAPCAARVFTATRDARLIALDAQTGKPCEDFGAHGTLDLKADMGPDPAGYQYSSSSPLVVGDIVVVGTGIFDGQSTSEPSGVVRAFHVKDGTLAWAWDIGRPDDHGAPPPGQTYVRGTPNVWTLTSADPALGLIYLPTGNAPPDYFGGHRTPLMEKFTSSLVAVNIADGSVRWSFQTTHHDIWDYDIASQPVLTDFPTPAGPVPAVIQATKRGEIFVLDRRNGRLLTQVEERKVPTDAVAGDRAAPTQPFSVGMPSLAQPRMREADMWGLTPIDTMICRIMFREARYEGTLTPLGTQSTIQYPANWGVSNWGSVSVDPRAGILIAPANNVANYMRLIPRSSPEAKQYEGLQPTGLPQMQPENGAPQHGTPYAITNPTFMSPLMVPCNRPPFGRMYAIDLKTRKVLWVKPMGTARNSGPFGIGSGLPLPMGVPMNAGVLVTAGNLSFFAGSNDGYLRALSTRTGKELWREDLPVGSNATPMTYLAPKSGRQILLVSAGGAVGTLQNGDYMIAYRLPQK